MQTPLKLMLLFLGMIISNSIIQASQKSPSHYSPNSATGGLSDTTSPLNTSPREVSAETIEPYFATLLEMLKKETWDSTDFHHYFNEIALHRAAIETKKFKIFHVFDLEKNSIKVCILNLTPIDEPDDYGYSYKFKPGKNYLLHFRGQQDFYLFTDQYQLKVR